MKQEDFGLTTKKGKGVRTRPGGCGCLGQDWGRGAGREERAGAIEGRVSQIFVCTQVPQGSCQQADSQAGGHVGQGQESAFPTSSLLGRSCKVQTTLRAMRLSQYSERVWPKGARPCHVSEALGRLLRRLMPEREQGQPLGKMAWNFLETLGIKLPHDPAIPLLGPYPKKRKPSSPRDSCVCSLQY